VLLNTDILPKLNYVSMNWNEHGTSDSRSPADTTTVVRAVNAAAVKYLNDQQLVQQAVAAAGGRDRKSSSRLARRSGHAAPSSSDASVYGIKSANLSLASRRYFEKHQLYAGRADGGGSDQDFAAMSRMSKSKMEDLLNSITSQVNGMQVTMSPKHSTPGVDDGDYCFNHSVPLSRRQSDNNRGLLFGNETSRNLSSQPNSRKSFDGIELSDVLPDETCLFARHRPSQHRTSVNGSQQHH